MSDNIVCYRCGESLAALTPPLSRRDMCPACGVHVHVCRMCTHYDPQVIRHCREDEAEDVKDKDKVNFCDWFEPRGDAFDAGESAKQRDVQAALASLFGEPADTQEAGTDRPATGDAEDLFS